MSKMTDHTPIPPTHSHRPIVIIGSILAIIIIAGSIIAAYQAGFNFNNLRTSLGQLASRIGGANLYIDLDTAKLPADGKSQATIEVELINSQASVSASIISGDGQINRSDTDTEQVHFTYTAGTRIGNVTILVKAGALEEQIAIELVEAIQPVTPTITDPPDGSEINEPYPTVTGTGPANTKIAITNNGGLNTTTKTNEQGHFQVQLERPLYNGQHTLIAMATSDLGMTSSPSNLVTITIATDPVTLDVNNLRVVPKSPPVGESFAVFVPASIGTTRVILEIAGRNLELFDYNESSIFTGVFASPDQPGVYFGDIILVDVAGNANRFEQLIRLSVVS